jgi:hypothetical protein
MLDPTRIFGIGCQCSGFGTSQKSRRGRDTYLRHVESRYNDSAAEWHKLMLKEKWLLARTIVICERLFRAWSMVKVIG